MQLSKRRGARSSSTDLPLTNADTSRPMSKRGGGSWDVSHGKQRNNQKGSILRTCCLFVVFVILLIFFLTREFTYDDYMSHPATQKVVSLVGVGGDKASSSSLDARLPDAKAIKQSLERRKQQERSLEKFKSLEYALSNAKLVGIYFAAKWCPMSTPVTELLEKIFSYSVASADQPEGHTLDWRVLPPIEERSRDGQGTPKDLALVYVSSDKDEQDMNEYSRYNWINVPFDSPDRSDIKRHYKACAKPEMRNLGIENRRFEIPSLLIVDSVTQGVLSTTGVEDLEEYGTSVLDHWLELQKLTRTLEDKFM